MLGWTFLSSFSLDMPHVTGEDDDGLIGSLNWCVYCVCNYHCKSVGDGE